MRARIIKIGNSQEIRIPKTMLKQLGFGEEVELEVNKDHIVIKAVSQGRKGWETAFQEMANRGDDKLLNEEITNSWDEEEWAW
jgi:antitoxin MazE